jgi:predicted nucleic acid-binding protein
MLIYCDSAILIYFHEHTGPFFVRAAARLAAMAAAGDEVAVSDLVRLECRIKPIRLGNTAALAIFDGFFAQPGVRRLPMTSAVFDRATLIRAHHKFALGDSLHLAAAVESGCDRFLTNDARLSKFTDLPVEVLP